MYNYYVYEFLIWNEIKSIFYVILLLIATSLSIYRCNNKDGKIQKPENNTRFTGGDFVNSHFSLMSDIKWNFSEGVWLGVTSILYNKSFQKAYLRYEHLCILYKWSYKRSKITFYVKKLFIYKTTFKM